MNEFKELNGHLPKDVEENETVWLFNQNTGIIMLGCLVHLVNEGWFWAKSNGIIYSEGEAIISEAEIEDDYEFTHYCKLPKLPVK